MPTYDGEVEVEFQGQVAPALASAMLASWLPTDHSLGGWAGRLQLCNPRVDVAESAYGLVGAIVTIRLPNKGQGQAFVRGCECKDPSFAYLDVVGTGDPPTGLL